MLLCEYTFAPGQESDRSSLRDEVEGLLGALRNNGQIWGEEVLGLVDGALKVWLNVPRADALSEEHSNDSVREALHEVEALCATNPTWNVVDDRADLARKETWQDSDRLFLFTHLLDKTSPVCDGSTGRPVPSYLLPVSSETRWELERWAETYRTLDEIQMGCGPLEVMAYRQLAESDSDQSERGRSLCKALEEATGKPTFYYLMRHWGHLEGESARPCPGCGQAWARPASVGGKGIAWFDFRCDPCRLVSHMATSFDSEALAAIGEWCSRRAAAKNGGSLSSPAGSPPLRADR